MAERVIDIEEAELQNVRSCEDVLVWARISNASPVFDPIERRAILTYSRPGSKLEMTRQMIEEVIEW